MRIPPSFSIQIRMKEEGEVEKDLEEVDVDLENDLQDFAQAANELECFGEGLLQ